MLGSRNELKQIYALEAGDWCRGARDSRSVLSELVGPMRLASLLNLHSKKGCYR